MDEVPERTPIATSNLSVILLVHDTAAELEDVLLAWVEFLKAQERTFELIVVDDGSTDGSGRLADQLAERWSQIRVLHHATHEGQGGALRTGLTAAKEPLVFYTLGNKQYQPPDLNQLLGMIDQADLVSGFRVCGTVPWWLRTWDFFWRWFNRIIFGLPLEPRPGWLGWSGWGRRLQARWIFGVELHDPECAYRLFRREILRRVVIQSQGTLAHVEVIAKANFLGALMVEVPISFVPRPQPPEQRHEAMRLFSDPDFGPTRFPPPERFDAPNL